MGTWQRVTVVTACSLSGIVFWEKGFPLVSPRIFSRLMDMTLRWWLPYASREFVIREQGEGTPRVARGGLLPHPPPLRSLPDSALLGVAKSGTRSATTAPEDSSLRS